MSEFAAPSPVITDSDYAQLDAYVRACRLLYKSIEACAIAHENNIATLSSAAPPGPEKGQEGSDGEQWVRAQQTLSDIVQETSFEAPRGVADEQLRHGVNDVLSIYTYVNILRECRTLCADRDSVPLFESEGDGGTGSRTATAILDQVYANMCGQADESYSHLEEMTRKLSTA